MKVVQNTEQSFKAAFEKCLLALELDSVQNQNWILIPAAERTPETQFQNALREMHRRFVYEINTLRSELENN